VRTLKMAFDAKQIEETAEKMRKILKKALRGVEG
jgi:hypothetical protein